MLIYNLYDILSFEYQPSGLKVYIIMLTQNINMPFGVARTSVYARFARYFGLSELRHYDL